MSTRSTNRFRWRMPLRWHRVQLLAARSRRRSGAFRACQCSFCRAHQALEHVRSGRADPILGTQAGPLQRYRFGQRTADFLLCRECGVYIGAEMQADEGRFGIINVNALRPIPADLAAARAHESTMLKLRGLERPGALNAGRRSREADRLQAP